MRNGFLGALGLLMAMAIAFLGACAPSSSSGGNHPADDDASPADDDASPTDDDDNDTTPPADDDGSPDDDDNDDTSPADDDDNDDNDDNDNDDTTPPTDDDNDDDSATDVFAVGDNGTILHYDGTTWSPMASGTTLPLQCVWGSSGSDVYAVGVGTIIYFDGSAWSNVPNVPEAGNVNFDGVWGTSPSDVLAVGGDQSSGRAVIMHYNGTMWSVQWTAGASLGLSQLRGVWGSADSGVFAVGEWSLDNYPPSPPVTGGFVVDKDGASWTTSANSDMFGPFLAVWGTSHSDVFAVGWIPNETGNPGGNQIVHYDGVSWSDMAVPTQDVAAVYGIWGTSSSDVFAIGQYYKLAFIDHYDGSSWSQLITSPFQFLGLWGGFAADVFVVGCDGNAGLIVHYDGSAWITMLAGLPNPLWSVWGVAK